MISTVTVEDRLLIFYVKVFHKCRRISIKQKIALCCWRNFLFNAGFLFQGPSVPSKPKQHKSVELWGEYHLFIVCFAFVDKKGDFFLVNHFVCLMMQYIVYHSLCSCQFISFCLHLIYVYLTQVLSRRDPIKRL